MSKDRAYITDMMRASRIPNGGLIEELPFSLNDEPFSICVIPKANITDGVISQPDNIGLIIPVVLLNSDTAKNFPVFFCQWTEAAIKSIHEDAFAIETYDVYYGTPIADEAES